MNRSLFFCVAFLLSTGVLARASTTITFEDAGLADNRFYNGSDGAGGFTSGPASSPVSFNNSFDKTFGNWAGFAESTMTDTTTAGFGNQYSAAASTGAGNSRTYAVGFVDGFTPFIPTITLPVPTIVQSASLTNTTYAYLAMHDGNDGGFNSVRQFGSATKGGHNNDGVPDTFTLTITGKDASGAVTGSLNVFLADYRSADNASDYVLNAWQNADLSSLGVVKSLEFTLASTDQSTFDGVTSDNTPDYFALDNLVVTGVPEPATAGIILAGCGLLLRRRRKA